LEDVLILQIAQAQNSLAWDRAPFKVMADRHNRLDHRHVVIVSIWWILMSSFSAEYEGRRESGEDNVTLELLLKL